MFCLYSRALPLISSFYLLIQQFCLSIPTLFQTLHQQIFSSFHYGLITSKAPFSEYHSYIFTWKVFLTRSLTSTVIRPAIRITSPMYRVGHQNIRCSHCQHICSMTLQVTVLFLKAVNNHLCEEYVP